jgi:hypothetical protein
MFVKLVLLITFLLHFLKLFQWIWNQHEILHFLYLFYFKENWVIFVLFLNFEAKRPKKRRQKSLNVLSKCVLDLNFAPIKGSVFLFFLNKVKFVVPYWRVHLLHRRGWQDVVSLNNVSLDDPSGILYPMDFVSFGRCLPWVMRPLHNASLTDGFCYIGTLT